MQLTETGDDPAIGRFPKATAGAEAWQADWTVTETANEAELVAARVGIELRLDAKKLNAMANRANFMGFTRFVIYGKRLG